MMRVSHHLHQLLRTDIVFGVFVIDLIFNLSTVSESLSHTGWFTDYLSGYLRCAALVCMGWRFIDVCVLLDYV